MINYKRNIKYLSIQQRIPSFAAITQATKQFLQQGIVQREEIKIHRNV